MRVATEAIPAKLDAPGVVARRQTNFGDAAGYGMIGGEYFSLDAGADIAPLLKGLEGDLCQSPHWGATCCKGKLPSPTGTARRKLSTAAICSTGRPATP